MQIQSRYLMYMNALAYRNRENNLCPKLPMLEALCLACGGKLQVFGSMENTPAEHK